MSLFPFLRTFHAVVAVINAYDDAKLAARFLGGKTRELIRRFAEDEIKNSFDDILKKTGLYFAVNCVFLLSLCFLGHIVGSLSETLVAAACLIVLTRFVMNGHHGCMELLGRWRKKQLRGSCPLNSTLDTEIGEWLDLEVLAMLRPKIQGFLRKSGIVAITRKIAVWALGATFRKHLCLFLLRVFLAGGIYWVILCKGILPFLNAPDAMDTVPVLLEPFTANSVWAVLFAILSCWLFPRTTWCVHRRHDALASCLAWLLFLVLTVAVLYRAHFTEIGTVIFVQTFFTLKKCTTGYYIRPECLD